MPNSVEDLENQIVETIKGFIQISNASGKPITMQDVQMLLNNVKAKTNLEISLLS